MSVVAARRHTTREKAAQTERGHCRAAGIGCHFCGLAHSDPHVSKPSFRVESEKVCLQDLNRPSSLSKATFVSVQAKSGPNRLGFGGP